MAWQVKHLLPASAPSWLPCAFRNVPSRLWATVLPTVKQADEEIQFPISLPEFMCVGLNLRVLISLELVPECPKSHLGGVSTSPLGTESPCVAYRVDLEMANTGAVLILKLETEIG